VSAVPEPIRAMIFDVDGVLVDSPHEQAWRDALDALMTGPWRDLDVARTWTPGGLNHDLYQRHVAGKPRLDGARTVLAHFGIPDPDGDRAAGYAAAKQRRVVELIERGAFRAFDDAVRLVLAARARGWRVAAASSSRNASLLLRRIPVPGSTGMTLADALDADLSGRPVPRGKPDPAIFLAAADALETDPAACLVVEDAPVGIRAAVAGGMRSIGIARDGDHGPLQAAGADYVVSTLDECDLASIAGIG
jgi:beta-phosphoglucomutase